MKVTTPSASVDAGLRRLALTAISLGRTPAALRAESAGTPNEARCRHLADEVEVLAASGVTQQIARREIDARDPRRGKPLSAETMRQVAGIFLGEGIAARHVRGLAADPEALARISGDDIAATRDLMAGLAGAMDELAGTAR